MATLSEIIAEAATIKETTRSSADQALSLSRIHKRLFIRLGRDSNQYTVAEDVTVADQEAYNLPTGCKIHSIVNNKIQVEDAEDSETYTDFPYYTLDQMNDYDSYYTRGSTDSTYYLYENGSAISDSDRKIIINYYKNNTDFGSSDLTVVPSLDLEYHDYLIYMLVAENCACGDDPDTELADYWRSEAEELFREIKYRMDDNLNTAPARSSEAREMM